MNQHGVNDLLTAKPTLDTLRLSKAQKTALYTLIASVRPKKKEEKTLHTGPSMLITDKGAIAYNRGLQDYDNAIKELLYE